MYFRINGALVYSRGANVVPMHVMEGRWSDEAHVELVKSAATAGINMLRVWGGGALLPQAFYDACDEYGILLYHDLFFVGEQNHSAFWTADVEDEVRHIVRKLASHPSIVLWSGCNECDYYNGGDMGVYESFVMPIVAREDDTRALWPSSPSSYGWETGVDTLYGRPNGHVLKIRTHALPEYQNHVLETHGPYHHGYSTTYPGVNGGNTSHAHETHLPPRFFAFRDPQHITVGLQFPNTFVSEFGSSVSSSFESMSALLPPDAWNLHGGAAPDTCEQTNENENSCNGTNVMAER